MKPKNRKDILDTCQNNFWNYSGITKFLVVLCVLLSAAMMVLYICEYIFPTFMGIIDCEIVGWDIILRIGLGFMLYILMDGINIFLVSLGGVAMCREEKWDIEDFSNAWVNNTDSNNEEKNEK